MKLLCDISGFWALSISCETLQDPDNSRDNDILAWQALCHGIESERL